MGAVIVVGSINRDVFFRVSSLPVAGQTVTAMGAYDGLGGKGANQAVACARMGAEVAFVGAVGEDDGPDERFQLRELGVDVSEVQSVPNVSTGSAYVVVSDSGENQIVLSPGANAALDVDGLIDSLEMKLRAAAGGAVVVTQGELGAGTLERVIDVTRRIDSELPVSATLVVNLAPVVPVTPAVLSRADLLVVNEGEAADLVAELSAMDHVPAAQALEIQESAGVELCRRLADFLGTSTVVTLGGEGAVLAEPRTNEVLVQPAVPVDEVVDTTGAGDCFVGVLAASIASGSPVSDALRSAVTAATYAVRSAGTTPSFPEIDMVARALAPTPAHAGPPPTAIA